MSKEQQSDTDLIEVFQENIETLKVLFGRMEKYFQANRKDPLMTIRLRAVKNELLVEDIKLQDLKIEKLTSVLDEIKCSQTESKQS